MDRWLTVEPSLELSRLEEALVEGDPARQAVPVLRAWGDAVVELRSARAGGSLRTASRLGAFILRPASAVQGADQLLVAAERCAVAPAGSMARLYRGSEWRHVKRALTEDGFDAALVEELLDPTTHDGTQGRVAGDAVASHLLSLDNDIRVRVEAFFEADIDRYLADETPLAEFGEDGAIDASFEVIVPWSAVMVLRSRDGIELNRA